MIKVVKIVKIDILVIKKYIFGVFLGVILGNCDLRLNVCCLFFGSYILKKIGVNRNYFINVCIGKCKNFVKIYMLFLVCVVFLGNIVVL